MSFRSLRNRLRRYSRRKLAFSASQRARAPHSTVEPSFVPPRFVRSSPHQSKEQGNKALSRLRAGSLPILALCRDGSFRPRRRPADQLIGPSKPSWYRVIRRARNLQTETRGKPDEMSAAVQLQRLSLPARKQEQAGGIAIASVGQSSEQRERHGNHLAEERQIVRRDTSASDRDQDGKKEHGPERKLLCPIGLRSRRSRAELLEHLLKHR